MGAEIRHRTLALNGIEMGDVVPDLRRKLLLEGGGHWIQQERPAEVSAALIEFARAHLV